MSPPCPPGLGRTCRPGGRRAARAPGAGRRDDMSCKVSAADRRQGHSRLLRSAHQDPCLPLALFPAPRGSVRRPEYRCRSGANFPGPAPFPFPANRLGPGGDRRRAAGARAKARLAEGRDQSHNVPSVVRAGEEPGPATQGAARGIDGLGTCLRPDGHSEAFLFDGGTRPRNFRGDE